MTERKSNRRKKNYNKKGHRLNKRNVLLSTKCTTNKELQIFLFNEYGIHASIQDVSNALTGNLVYSKTSQIREIFSANFGG